LKIIRDFSILLDVFKDFGCKNISNISKKMRIFFKGLTDFQRFFTLLEIFEHFAMIFRYFQNEILMKNIYRFQVKVRTNQFKQS
jgi:hypothetical protein